MRLLLIRHAPTAETGTRLSGRLPGIALSPQGREAAAALADRLGAIPVAALYTSPVQRCRETARHLGAVWGVEPTAYRSFIEADYGTWTGRSLASLRRMKKWRNLYVAASRFRFPGGETLGEVQSRAVAACEELSDRHSGSIVAVVSHNDVIRALLAHYLGMPLDMIHRLDALPASVSVVDLPAGGTPRVPVVNDAGGPERWR